MALYPARKYFFFNGESISLILLHCNHQLARLFQNPFSMPSKMIIKRSVSLVLFKHILLIRSISSAFPSIGCGKFGFDPSRIAQYMIDEALLQLLNSTSTIIVSFVLKSDQQNVYDEFVKYLQSVSRTVPATTTKLPSKSKRSVPLKIAYDEKSNLSRIFNRNSLLFVQRFKSH